MWIFSIDLMDASFHIPIHPSSRQYLRICMGKQVFQFKTLPFGISSAPKALHQDLQTTGIYSQKIFCHSTISRRLAVVLGEAYKSTEGSKNPPTFPLSKWAEWQMAQLWQVARGLGMFGSLKRRRYSRDSLSHGLWGAETRTAAWMDRGLISPYFRTGLPVYPYYRPCCIGGISNFSRVYLPRPHWKHI